MPVAPLTPSSTILTVGSANVDLVVGVDRFPRPGETLHGRSFARFPGGKGANQAYGVARLGGKSRLVAALGTDEHGTWLAEHLAAGGVDVGLVCRVPEPTGVALITIDAGGQNEIVLVAGANAALTPERLDAARPLREDVRVVLLQLEVPLETVRAAARAARAAGAVVVLDPAPARDLPPSLLELVDILTPNETELTTLTGGGTAADAREVVRRARQLLDAGPGQVIVKRGAAGATLVTPGGVQDWPAPAVPVVDTTAAGDAFNAALAVMLAEGAAVEESVAFAVAAASVSVTRHGAQPSMPTRTEVERSLA